MLTTRDGFLLCRITNFYKVNNFCLLFQELSNPIFQDFHPFAWGRVSVYNGYQVNLGYNYSYFFYIYSCHFCFYCYIYYVLLPLLLHVNLEGWRWGTASSLGAGRHLLQLYKAGPNFEKVPLVDRLISCFSYFLVLSLCQIGRWCWWRGFSEAESSNLLAIGLCPNSDP